MTDFQKIEFNHAKDLSNLSALVAWAAHQQLTGSYSARHPDEGKMLRCPYCRTRRRQGAPKCCNPAYAKDKDGKERVIAQFFSKPFLKRLTHKKHGQSKPWKIRQLTYRFQNEPSLVEDSFWEMKERWPLLKLPDLAGIPAFAEKYFLFVTEKRDKAHRQLTRRSRQINRGA